jgi:hypothetical protein
MRAAPAPKMGGAVEGMTTARSAVRWPRPAPGFHVPSNGRLGLKNAPCLVFTPVFYVVARALVRRRDPAPVAAALAHRVE